MSEPIRMPALGESVTSGTVTTWLKNVGDAVSLDEPVLEVSTDKVDSEVPAPVEGILEQILVQEDEEVEVGTVLGYIGDGSGAASAEGAPEAATPTQVPAAPAPAVPAPVAEAPVAEAPSAPVAGAATGSAVTMPALGESVTEGTVTTWLKQVGDAVEVDEPLLEVSTDKVDSEVPSPASGVLQQILVQEDESVAVGTVLAYVGEGVITSAVETTAAPAPAPQTPPVASAPAAAAPAPAPVPVAEPVAQREAAAPVAVDSEPSGYVTPIVRKLARELGVDLSAVTGTGVGGRIRRQDVEDAAKAAQEAAAAAAAAAAPAPAASAVPSSATPAQEDAVGLRGTTQKMPHLRQVIAKRMVESLQVSAQLTTVVEADVTRIVALRGAKKDEFLAKEGTKLTFLPFFVKAATDTLKSHPKLNATIDGKQVTYFDHEHIGIAVDAPKGLTVPVIKNAGDLNIAGIAKAINDLAARTRNSTIKPDELSGSTFTITNTGSTGALFDTPIINQPEVAILGIGGIVKRPAAVRDADGNEVIGLRSMVYLALSYDHRLVDGADAGRYLKDLKARLEAGDFEADLGI
ncbi:MULTISPECIES: 2-oxoglutarate dehydrogenase, E2 component, dihydrolipoamide succinyltransferase [unclassified Actinobaculum]|uniref:2-oxoglutarate dehydrogenase, E2 component, dihydrolipoamide succinyltransferase n=1 Tax=unclassified Actinobaculum TaxID=2609299 RepID=UPI000D52839F|nr:MULTISPECIES: 2-oxoglutarate dehydrogenase, E2 component, dihydrolipoamide succinyltransferase [unclassified Actinobaculum]AWE42543.1 2-oxoglutarate dehydrogenase, E2 component, dihydrolipoamide succinyltransferase [Actinobaculum sp. 313]RTE48846.1 2-oxoglutarate dehydrogenase, E2 component, dihydrolipoamide succinyltransferase [Actinobaculum sp. 352]